MFPGYKWLKDTMLQRSRKTNKYPNIVNPEKEKEDCQVS